MPALLWKRVAVRGKENLVFGAQKKSSADEVSLPQPFGRFYLQELINSGGMADIFLATDSNNKPYALRRLHDRLKFNFGARRRFVRGAEILSLLHAHPGMIGYVEHGKAEGLLYLLMEYVEASNLKEMLTT